ncbi:SufS family cysteine desulfurase [Spongorhabdus nitratireducens]
MTYSPVSSATSLSVKELRQDFPLLHQNVSNHSLVYLDNAATTQKPDRVIKVIDRFYRQDNANVHRASHTISARATHAFEDAREQVRTFLNAPHTDEIIWTRGATEAINLVAQSYGRTFLKPGDEILLSAMEHHANIVPWQVVAEQTGASIKVIPLTPKGELDMATLPELLSNKTRIVAVSHVSNAIGTVNPVQEIVRQAHAVSAIVLVDGAQAVSHFPVDVQQLGCDFYVFSGHKVFGPTGIGVLYGRQDLLNQMPPWQCGGEMIKQVSFDGTTFNTLPFKFEAGTPNMAGSIGLAAALEFLQQQDRTSLQQHEEQLRVHAEQRLRQIPEIRLVGTARQKVSVVSFTVEGIHNQDIGFLLNQKGIAVRTGHHCAMPLMDHLGIDGTIRASFAPYNTLEEVDYFVDSLQQIIKQQLYSCNASEPSTQSESNQTETAATSLEAPFSQFSTDQNAANTLLDALHSSRDWQSRYRQLMLMGKNMAPLEQHWKTEDSRLHGCESQVWLHHHYDDNSMKLYFAADSDARIIRGLIMLVMLLCNGKTALEIQSLSFEDEFETLGLLTHLSPSRGNGLRAIVDEICSVAHRYL